MTICLLNPSQTVSIIEYVTNLFYLHITQHKRIVVNMINVTDSFDYCEQLDRTGLPALIGQNGGYVMHVLMMERKNA